MEDSTITCIQCGDGFAFPAHQRQRFERLGFDSPKRCPVCRKNKLRLEEPNSGIRHHRRSGKVLRMLLEAENSETEGDWL